MNNLRERFTRDRIYTRAANMLVVRRRRMPRDAWARLPTRRRARSRPRAVRPQAVNPGHPLPELYSDHVRTRSKAADLRDVKREPHLYDVAEQGFRQLVDQKKAQRIIISGESGAGKTESIKYCMNYLVWRAPSAETGEDATSGLTTRIMQSNPLLEAFGNAKTQRNNNSSRFGKYITLEFAESHSIVSAQINTFLLEKSRVTNADAQKERSYHVFYQLIAASPLAKGKTCNDFRMVNQSGTTEVCAAAATAAMLPPPPCCHRRDAATAAMLPPPPCCHPYTTCARWPPLRVCTITAAVSAARCLRPAVPVADPRCHTASSPPSHLTPTIPPHPHHPTRRSQIPGKPDRDEFQSLQIALGWFGMEPKVQEGLWEVLFGALHLANIIFEGGP